MTGHEKGRWGAPSDSVCSKGGWGGQWRRSAAALALSALCAGCSGRSGQAGAAAPQTPSGEPVPRYISLKVGTVNARQGPGEDYKLLWVYRTKGLPLQVIAETEDWRRVCDPDGGVAWIHRRTTEDRRTVMRASRQDLALRKQPNADAPEAAVLAARSIAELDRCEKGWCRVSVGHAKGWAPAAELWGTADAPQCR